MKPGLILIAGIRKCGTTSLYDILSRVKGVFTLRELKESQVFCLKRSNFENNITNLISKMKASQIFLDASTLSIYSSNSIPNIKSYFGVVKVIFIIRKPQKRFISAYLHNFKKKNDIEKRDIKNVIKPLLEKEGSKEQLEKIELQRCQKSGEININKIDYTILNQRYGCNLESVLDEEFTQLKYYKESCYSDYIKKWELEFGIENCHILSLEQLNSNPQKTLNDIINFLDLEPLEDYKLSQSNKTLIATSPIAIILKRMYRFFGLNNLVSKSSFIKKYLFKFREKIYQLDRTTLNDDNLDEILKSELDYWKKRSPEIYKHWVN